MKRFKAIREACNFEEKLKKEKAASVLDGITCQLCGTNYSSGSTCAICDGNFFSNHCQVCNTSIPEEINVCHKCVQEVKKIKKAASELGNIGISTAHTGIGSQS